MTEFSIATEPSISLSPAAKNCTNDLVKHLENDKTVLANEIGQ